MNQSELELKGNDLCPCLTEEYFRINDHDYSEETPPNFETKIGTSIDPKQYGIGCLPHDEDALQCADTNDCTSMIPLPVDCDKSYCKRSWCFVSPHNCLLLHNPSPLYTDRYYSYATCGELDSFAYTDRLKSLNGKTFQVGYIGNSGGWKGAFNPSGSFAVNNQWTGPAVDFVRTAARDGGFTINMTQPPEWLRPYSQKFFGNSNADFCVYAVSLGYLDFCVGDFSINEKRSSITTMFETGNDPIYLIAFSDGGDETDWESFVSATLTIFQPFTASAWAMIFLFCLPVLGLLMYFHEYGTPGSAYPKTEPVLIERDNGLGEITTKVITRPVPAYKHVFNSLYMGTLSFFQGSYDQSVVSLGGKINLLAIASFIMLIIAVYTANLAAILTQDLNKASVDSLDMALKQGMNICAERKIAAMVMETYGVDPSKIVPDPIEIGGDGQPGFNCPNCNTRERIFNSMRRIHNDPGQYCNVAIAGTQDLDVLHGYGNHCDKIKVGDSISYRAIGMPISDRHSEALVSFLHKEKADGVMTQTLTKSVPQSHCPETSGEGSALSVKQLTGVWVITFALALLALLARLVKSCRHRLKCCKNVNHRVAANKAPEKKRMLRRYDQWGNAPPHDVVVDGYRYDAESNELHEVSLDITTDDDSVSLLRREKKEQGTGASSKSGMDFAPILSLSYSQEETNNTHMTLPKVQ